MDVGIGIKCGDCECLKEMDVCCVLKLGLWWIFVMNMPLRLQHGDTCNILVLIESYIMITYVCFPKKARIWFDCVSQIRISFPFDYVG